MNGAKYILCSGRLSGICSKLYPVNLFRNGTTDSRAFFLELHTMCFFPEIIALCLSMHDNQEQLKSRVQFSNCHICENFSSNNTNTQNCCLIIATKETVSSGLWIEGGKKKKSFTGRSQDSCLPEEKNKTKQRESGMSRVFGKMSPSLIGISRAQCTAR